jgi:hypothetical protein
MIAKQDFEQLMNQAKVKLVGASEGGLKGELYDVLTEFFNDSHAWTEHVAFTVIPHQHHYHISVSEGIIFYLNGIHAPQHAFVPALMPDAGPNGAELVIKHAATTNLTYYAEVVKNCSLPTSRDMLPIAPDWVLPRYHVGILDGLLGKMMHDKNKSYADAVGSTYHLKRFRDAIARARVDKLRANTMGSSAWRFPQQFRSTSQQSGVPAIGSASERSF